MLAITNATIVMRDYLIPNASLLIENGKIADFGKKISIPDSAELLDANGLFVGPGLIDIHTHADGIRFFHEDPAACSETLLKHGVTSVLPALYFSFTKEEYLKSMELLCTAVEKGVFPNFAGFYMEGPYLNPKFGGNKNENPWGGIVREEDYKEIIQKATGFAKIWCVAPELPNIDVFAEDVKKAIPNIIFSVAHSEATPEQVEALIPYGLRLATHHTNAVGAQASFSECRGIGVEEAVNYNDDIYAEIICDSLGIHVNPYLQRLIRKMKGENKIILISDAFIDHGPPLPGCEEADDLCFDFDGEIAGARMTLDTACRNMLVHTGCSLCDVFRYASLNPARLLGFNDLGEIKKGNTANIIITDHWMQIKNTILKGEIVQ